MLAELGRPVKRKNAGTQRSCRGYGFNFHTVPQPFFCLYK
jgi:hypothetical protein